MSFFPASQQQQLMSQMFMNPQGGQPMPPPMQGQGGIGQNAPQIGPSFVAPGDGMGAMGGAPNDLGVEAPDQFNRPVPDIGGDAMMRSPPPNFSDNMPNDLAPGYMGDFGANQVRENAERFGNGIQGLGGDAKRRLIEAIISRGVI